MSYPRVLLVVALVAPFGCGDNLAQEQPPDARPPDGGGEACAAEVSAAALANGTWDERFTVPGFAGEDGLAPAVYDFARDVDGSIVAAGTFDYLGSARVEPLLRWRNGAWEPARSTWQLAPNIGFSAVAIDAHGRMALATYDSFGVRSGELWLDDGTGLRVIGTFDGLIRTLAWYDGDLWAAGWAQITSGTVPVQGLAVWNGTSWTQPPGGPADGSVFEIVHDGDELLIGGAFAAVGGIPAANVAAFDGTQWRALDFPDVTVYALARDAANALYAGGTFGLAFGETGGIARWTGTAWQLASGGLGNDGIVGVATDLVAHGGSLYVSGCFSTAGGTSEDPAAVVTRNVARFDGQWHALDDDSQFVLSPWYEPRGCGDEGPDSVWNVSQQRMFSDGDRLLFGGMFPGAAGVASQSVIAYDGTNWVPQGPRGLGIGGSIDRIGASASCEVWGLGQLSHVAGAATRAHVVRFTGTGWEAVTDALPTDAYCPGFAVSATGDVAVGCMLFPADAPAVGRVYRVAGTELVQAGGDLPLVQTLAYDPDGRLWAGGGEATGFVARLDGDAFTIVEDGFDAPVQHLAPVGGSDVIAAGPFAKVDALDAVRIARWDGAAWRALGTGLPATPSALARDGTKVYVSTYDEGRGQLLLGAFDGTAWTELATPAAGLTPAGIFNFNALRVVGGAVIAVGSVVLDDESARGAVVFENGRFRALGGGVHGTVVTGIAVAGDAIWIAGGLAEANAAAPTSTVGVARYVLPE